jgi:hypothetical protein
MPLFADSSDTVEIVKAVASVVTAIVTLIGVPLVTAYLVMQKAAADEAAKKVEAVRVEAVSAAKDVKEVKTALEETGKAHDGKLDRIIHVQDGQTERLLRLIVVSAQKDAERTGSEADRRRAADAEAELKAHIDGHAASQGKP